MKVDDAWLQSDGQIINRAQKTPHESGVLWTTKMPDGKDFGVAMEKADASSITMYCNMVRDEWNERKEESQAKARSSTASPPPVGERGDRAADVPNAEENVAQVESFGEGLLRQLGEATAEYNEVVKRERELAYQVKALKAAVEALDAPENVPEERTSIAVETGERISKGVGSESRQEADG